MLTKLLGFVVGREPVATATGIAALVTAGLGVGAAFGMDITAEQIAAIGALAAALAGWLGRRAVTPVAPRMPRVVDERGGIGKGLAVLVVVVLLGFAACLAVADDNETDSLGRIELVSHDYDDEGCWDGECSSQEYDQNYGSRDDRNRNRNRDRGAFSPGPFRDSPVTICAPYSCNSGGEQSGGNRSDNPPPEEREMR